MLGVQHLLTSYGFASARENPRNIAYGAILRLASALPERRHVRSIYRLPSDNFSKGPPHHSGIGRLGRFSVNSLPRDKPPRGNNGPFVQLSATTSRLSHHGVLLLVQDVTGFGLQFGHQLL